METLLILLAVVLGLFILNHFLFKTKKSNKPVIPVKTDTPPYTKDRQITLYRQSSFTIDKDSLEFGDVDGDEVTAVRFFGEGISKVYTNPEMTIEYLEGTALPLDFKLYVKLDDKGDEVYLRYNVKSNNTWGN